MYDKRYFMTIAASDNSGGAGIQQDLKVADRLGFWALSVVTGITVQSFLGVDKVYPLDLNIIREQFVKNVSSFPVKVIKIGALCSIEIAKLITELLIYNPEIPVVVDPVIAPTKGTHFIEEKDISVYLDLLKRATLVTPNKRELELLTNSQINSYEDALEKAEDLLKKTACNVYIKGGHFSSEQEDIIEEYLLTPLYNIPFTKAKKNFKYSHGTGCYFSSAVACNILKYGDLEKACQISTEEVSSYYAKIKQ